jgi:hypothetical protein
VAPGERFPCGGRTYLSESACMGAGPNCCWSQDPITAIWCFDRTATTPSSSNSSTGLRGGFVQLE